MSENIATENDAQITSTGVSGSVSTSTNGIGNGVNGHSKTLTQTTSSCPFLTNENINELTAYVSNIFFAVLILVIGKLCVQKFASLVRASMVRAKVEKTLYVFTENIITVVGMIFVIIAALEKLGMPSASLVAAVGAAGLAIGLSLQGALSNFAAGILIIFFKPYKIGDLIEADGTIGTVREIEMFTTTLLTPDNKTVIIPNSSMTSGQITNFTETDEIRVDLVFGAGYDDDIDKVKQVMLDVMAKDDRILKEPAPLVAVVEHGESSVNYVCRPWTLTKDYWGVYFDLNEQIKKAFDAEGISIPYPQRDVHIHNVS